MPDIVTFDGPNKVITEISAAGDNELDVVEIYSEWKDWVRVSDNAKFEPAFAVTGGDPITATQNLGSTFFLENGWRIRPAELDHKLTLVGNLFTREEGQSAFLSTLGAYTVNTETRVSALVFTQIQTTGSGLSTQQNDWLERIHSLLDVVEGTLDHQEVMRILLAAAAGKLAGAEGTNVTVRDQADTKNRIDATVDEFGNRTTVTIDAS